MWENVVTACGACNLRKGSRLPREAGCIRGSQPEQPTTSCCRKTAARFPPNYLHDSWRDYLYWDSELES